MRPPGHRNQVGSNVASAALKKDVVKCAKIVSLYKEYGVSRKDLADRYSLSLRVVNKIIQAASQ